MSPQSPARTELPGVKRRLTELSSLGYSASSSLEVMAASLPVSLQLCLCLLRMHIQPPFWARSTTQAPGASGHALATSQPPHGPRLVPVPCTFCSVWLILGPFCPSICLSCWRLVVTIQLQIELRTRRGGQDVPVSPLLL